VTFDSQYTRALTFENVRARRLRLERQQVLAHASIPPAVNQIELHPYLRQNELLHFCREKNIVIMAYSPLGSPGRDTKPPGEPSLIEEKVVGDAAAAASVTRGQLLLLWAWHRGVVAIPKSVTPSRISENFRAWSGIVNGSIRVQEREFARVCALERGLRYVPGDRLLRPGQTVADFWGETDVV
jgi:alcohol dehydrogenase (NADP+)